MRLRIRHAAGMSTLTDLTAQDSVCNLKKQVANTLGVEYYQNIQGKPEEQVVKKGPIDLYIYI
jgi:hypothetical protein